MITHQISLVIGKTDRRTMATVKQHDTGIRFQISLHTVISVSWDEQQVAYKIPAHSRCIMQIVKPDRTYCTITGQIENNSAIFKMPGQAFAAAGDADAEVSVYSESGDRITSATFRVEIEREVLESSSTPSNDYNDLLVEQIRRAEAAQKGAESACEKSLTHKSDAERAARVSTSHANAAEASQKSAAESARTAMQDAASAEKNASASEKEADRSKAEADRARDNILNVVQSHNADPGAHADLRGAISRVESIARGRTFAKVFASKRELDGWLLIPDNVAGLEVGTNLYIEDVDTPDYWWDGTAAQPLEVEHPDLSQYVTKTQLSMELPAVVSQAEYDRLEYAGQLVAGRIYYVVVS